MKKMKLVRLILKIVLAVTAVTCFTFVGVKTANCIKYSKITNNCTAEINQTMYDNLTEFNIPGTESYNKIQELSAKRDEANEQYTKWEAGLVGFSIAGFISAFVLVFFLVNGVKSSD